MQQPCQCNPPPSVSTGFWPISVAWSQLQDGNDLWTYIWGSSAFTSKKAYLQLIGSKQVHLVFNWLWKSQCQPRRKLFFWLLLKDRLNTRELLRRKTMALESYFCALCHLDSDETLVLSPLVLLHLCRMIYFKPFLHSRTSSISLSIWRSLYWFARNDLIFRNLQHSVGSTKVIFKKEMALVKLGAKKISTNVGFMSRQLCIILFIFFVTFFVSWWCTPELPVIFSEVQ
jgi:hypothetical protein